MSAHQAQFRIATTARVLGVSTSGYCAWRGRPLSACAQADADLTARVEEIHTRSRCTYGSPRIHAELAEAGVPVSRKRVARVMRAAGLAGVSRRREIAAQNKAVVYGLLFRTVADTLRTIAADPRHLGAEIGFFAVLHTWGQTLVHHPHLHCVIPGGGARWQRQRLGRLPSRVLPAGPGPLTLLRRVLLAALDDAFESGQLCFAGRLQPLSDPRRFAEHLRPARETEWVVYAKRPFAGPEQVLDYLGRYTHRIAISNQRLRSLDDGSVRFRYTDYRRNGASRHKTMTLAATEFIRRMLLHVLPLRLSPHPLLRLPRQSQPPAEAGRVPAVAGHPAASTGRADRPGGHRLQRPLRGADRPLVAAVSPVP